MPSLSCTFDLDFTDYANDAPLDEMECVFPAWWSLLQRAPSLKTTWFVRIDANMEARFGDATFAFRRHGEALERLQSAGHEIGWHHHAYREARGKWLQEWDEARLLEQLRRHGEHARRLGLRAARMGWGQHTNATLRELAALGFELDSSAIPRPRYEWETITLRDWSTTGQDPYYPSVRDYRTAGEPALELLEIPISTVPLARVTDTVPGMKRYISLTYEEQVLREALARCGNHGIVLITHPYELLPRASGQAAAGGMKRVARNLEYLSETYGRSITLAEVAAGFRTARSEELTHAHAT